VDYLNGGENAVQILSSLADEGIAISIELFIASGLLAGLSRDEQLGVTNVRANPNDPPDVLFERNGVETVGVELTEIMPPNRFDKDAFLRKLRSEILRHLELSELSANWVIGLNLTDDYAPKVSLPRGAAHQLAEAPSEFFAMQIELRKPGSRSLRS
jgi:hypothetical protein